jgi:4-hydroxy-3-methylbut-2-enyl diphosphate reductase
MIVVGGRTSSNSRQLLEVGKRHTTAHLVETADEMDPAWFAPTSVVGVCAGASTREADVQAVVNRLKDFDRAIAGGSR